MFGSSTTTSGGLFGTPTTGGLFGQPQQPQRSLFGAAPNTSTDNSLFGTSTSGGGGLFGSSMQQRPLGGLFGSSTTTQPEQQQPGGIFGSTQPVTGTTTSGLFGRSTPSGTLGSGLFGSTSQAQQTTTGGLFGSTQPTTTSTSMFGSTPTTGGNLFGSTTSPTAFGTLDQPTGTRDLKYRDDLNKDQQGAKVQAICNMPEINQQKNLEELRWEDYKLGLTPGKSPTSLGVTGTTSGLFGSTPTTGSLLGSSQPQPTSGLFGNTQPNTTTSGLFGTSGGGGLFGQKPATAGLFGSTTTTPTTGGLFGSSSTTPQGGGLFGATQPQQTTSTGLFGTSQPSTTGGGLFGQSTTTGGGLFGQSATTGGGLFGSTTQNTSGGLFGQQSTTTGGGLYGQQPTTSGGLFGSTQPQQTTSTGLFGTSQPSTTGTALINPGTSTAGSGLFGSATPTSTTTGGGGLFGTTQQSTSTGGLFGSTTGGGLFGQKSTIPTTSGLFGQTTGTTTGMTGGGLFDQKPATNVGLFNSNTISGGGLFSQPSTTIGTTSTGLFGQPATSSTGTGGGGLFGTTNISSGLFSNTLGQPQQTQSVFGGINPQQTSAVALPQQLGSSGIDPYGIQRLGLMSGLYGAPAITAMLSGWPGAIPNPFAFPTPGVILPTQFRRYKSATLSQLWRPLPEYTADHRRLALPSATPRRLPRSSHFVRSPAPVSSAFKSDYGWNEYELSNLLYPSRQSERLAFRGSSVTGRLSTDRAGQWTPFRRTVSDSDDEGRYTTNRSPRSLPQPFRRLRQKWKDGQDTGDKVLGQLHDTDVRTPLRRAQRQQIYEAELSEEERNGPVDFRQGLSSSMKGGMTHSMGRFYPDVPLTHRLDSGYTSEAIGRDKSLLVPKRVIPRSRSAPLREDWVSTVRQTGRVKLGLKQHNAAPKCTIPGYSTKPLIETLQGYNENRLAVVEDFTVVHDGFGEVTWPGLTDVRDLNIDEAVKIENKAIEVYPASYTEKTGNGVPDVGVGLNKPALVTLLNCKPKDLNVTDETSEEFQQIYEDHVRKLRKYTEKMTAHFISLSPQWAWKFRVDHFSRYGYEEEEENQAGNSQSTETLPQQPNQESQSSQPKTPIQQFMSIRLIPPFEVPFGSVKPLSIASHRPTKKFIGHSLSRRALPRSLLTPRPQATAQPSIRNLNISTITDPMVNRTKLELLCIRLGLISASSNKSESELIDLLFGDQSKRKKQHKRRERFLFDGFADIQLDPNPGGLLVRGESSSRADGNESRYGMKLRRIILNDQPPKDETAHITQLNQQRNEAAEFMDEFIKTVFGILGDRFGTFPLQQTEIDKIIWSQLKLHSKRLHRHEQSVTSFFKTQIQTSFDTWALVAILFGTIIPEYSDGGECRVDETDANMEVPNDHVEVPRNRQSEFVASSPASPNGSTSDVVTPITAQKVDSLIGKRVRRSSVDKFLQPTRLQDFLTRSNQRDSLRPRISEMNPSDVDCEMLLRIECLEKRQRLELLSAWLSSVNRRTIMKVIHEESRNVENKLEEITCIPSGANKRLEKAFLLLIANDVPNAVNELLGRSSNLISLSDNLNDDVRFIRLALALSGGGSSCIGGLPINHEVYFRQLLEWQKRNIYHRIPSSVLRFYHILAGCIDRLVTSQSPDWKSVLGLLLWYPSPDADVYISPNDIELSDNDDGSTGTSKTETSCLKLLDHHYKPFSTKHFQSVQDDGSHCDEYSLLSPPFELLPRSSIFHRSSLHSTFNDEYPASSVIPSTSLAKALDHFSYRLLNIENQSSTPSPLPDWRPVERRPLLPEDIPSVQYNLLRLYANRLPQNANKQLFEPSAHSPHGIDPSLSWLLARVLPIPSQLISSDSEESSDNHSINVHLDLRYEILDYLNRVLAHQLEELGLWHHAVLIKFVGCMNNESPNYCDILSTILRHTPNPLTVTPNQLSQFRVQSTFLTESLGLPPIFVHHCQGQSFSSSGMTVEACDVWLECALTAQKSIHSSDSLSDNPVPKTPRSLFQRISYLNPTLYGSCLMSPASYFCNAVLSFLNSSLIHSRILLFCSQTITDSIFLQSALTPFSLIDSGFFCNDETSLLSQQLINQKSSAYIRSSQTMPLPSSQLSIGTMSSVLFNKDENKWNQYLEELFEDQVSKRRTGITMHGNRMLRKPLYQLCCDMDELGQTVIRPSEWKQTPAFVLCTMVIWIYRVFQLHGKIAARKNSVSPGEANEEDSICRIEDDGNSTSFKAFVEYELNQLKQMANSLSVVVRRILDNYQLNQIEKERRQLITTSSQLASVFSDALEYQSSLPFALTNVTTEILPTLLAIDRLIISCIQGSFICSNRLIDSNNKRSLIDYHGMSLILDSTSVP